MEVRVYSRSVRPLTVEEAERILLSPQSEKITKEPPVRPKAGDIYLFDFSDDDKKHGKRMGRSVNRPSTDITHTMLLKCACFADR